MVGLQSRLEHLYVNHTIDRATITFFKWYRAVGKKRVMSPAVLHFIYTVIIRTQVSYMPHWCGCSDTRLQQPEML